MRPPRASRFLRVFICGSLAGTLFKNANGLLSFRYEPHYDGPRLSTRMPIGDATYGNKVLEPYLAGLLPDSDSQREAIAETHGLHPNDYFSLLSVMGLDCPGGVQFCAPDSHPASSALSRESVYERLTEHDIAERLRGIRGRDNETWAAPDEHWSLGGNQGKFALALIDGNWCSCKGAAPTTHIFKHGVSGMKLEALDEYVCMRTAAACGVPTSAVEYQYFEDQPALVVVRYDRVETGGQLVRLHQEDACQALGFMPYRKYAADGGPSSRDIVRLLGGLGNVQVNLAVFTKMLFYNCLVWGIDAHAKNYSILIGPQERFVLAPMYDTASAFPYFRGHFKGKLAMSIGGKNQFGRISGTAIRRYAGSTETDVAEIFAAAGLDGDSCVHMMAELAESVPTHMERVFEESSAIPGASELRSRMLDDVCSNCQTILSAL